MKLIIAIICLFFTTGCTAQKNCDSIRDKLEYLECRKSELGKLDDKLEKKTSILLSNLSPLDKDCFNQSWNTWQKYREEFCSCYSSILKGNQSQRSYFDCMVRMTNDRIKQVNELTKVIDE